MKSRVALALIAAALAFPAGADAAFPGANGRIAFVRGDDIWTSAPDGSDQVDITNTPAATEDSPAWSADGRQIAYVRDGAIWVMSADGSGPREVVPYSRDPSICSGDDLIVSSLGDPTWSPDGSKIAFHDFRICYDDFVGQYQDYDLHTVNSNGTGRALVRRGGASPRWSPDGSKIGFTGVCGGGGCTDVRWITPDGAQEQVVYQTDIAAESFIDWSPDGFLMNGCGEFECFTIRPDGTGYQSAADVGHWSPDGKKLTSREYVVGPPGQYDIFTVNTNGSGSTNITNTSGVNEFDPDWQPVPYTGYPSPKGATPLRLPLVPAFNQCTAPNRTHGAPLSFPSCGPPSQTSTNLTVGSPDANGKGANSTGSVLFGVRPDSPSTPSIDETEFGVVVSITDVRKASDLSDYTGELQLAADVRISDKDNTPNPGGPGPGTVQDTAISATVPCTVTMSATIGSDCNLSTTVNALYPGAIRGGLRAVWQLGQVRVSDGGPDGLASTASGNALFLDQGIFVP